MIKIELLPSSRVEKTLSSKKLGKLPESLGARQSASQGGRGANARHSLSQPPLKLGCGVLTQAPSVSFNYSHL